MIRLEVTNDTVTVVDVQRHGPAALELVLNQSFCGGAGGGFLEKSHLPAGGII